ncbi:hypothetical protein K6H11_003217 [Candida tropicalis]
MAEVDQQSTTPVESIQTDISNETKIGSGMGPAGQDINDKSLSLSVDEVINSTSISAKSDSISSLSSINTANTTNNIIESLQSTKIIDDEEKDQTASAVAETSTSSNNNNNNNNVSTTSYTSTPDQQPNLIIKQIDPETLNTTTNSPKLPKSVASKTNFFNDLSQQSVEIMTPTSPNANISSTSPLPKKAVKFTVRKVSHEAIISPTSSPNLAGNGGNGGGVGAGFGKSPRVASHSRSHSHPEMGASNKNMSPPTSFIAQTVSSTEDERHKQELIKLEKAQAKYEQYGARITKIDKEINFLTQLLPPYNVEVDYNTRVKITKAIEKLRMKQDEIDKRKYDLGITISRLWRHLDDGSNIWVRKGE